jgi:hypothetical protein
MTADKINIELPTVEKSFGNTFGEHFSNLSRPFNNINTRILY